MPSEVVRGSRVFLRALGPRDIDTYVEAIGECRDQLRPWEPWVADESWRDIAAAWVRDVPDARVRGDSFGYGVFGLDDVLLGTVNLMRMEPGVFALGWWIRVQHVGRGFASAAAAAVTALAFGEGAARVEAHPEADNAPSVRIAEKLGMTCAGEVVIPGFGPAQRLRFVLSPDEFGSSACVDIVRREGFGLPG